MKKSDAVWSLILTICFLIVVIGCIFEQFATNTVGNSTLCTLMILGFSWFSHRLSIIERRDDD